MSLFRISEIKSNQASPEAVSPPHCTTQQRAMQVSGDAADVLKKIVTQLDQYTQIHWRSKGHFSMHDLLICLLGITGPADVWLTTWALTERPAKEIVQLVADGKIKSLRCVFDYKINDRGNAPVKMVEKHATQFAYAKCHAKMLVVRNETFAISVAGSANFTRNPRMEAGVIVCDKKVAEMDIAWISEALNDPKIKLPEL